MSLARKNPVEAVADHGGSLARAEAMFPDAPKPWIDLSTGINPRSYPLRELPASIYARLPEQHRHQELAALAADIYGAPGSANIVAAPGTQILLPLVMGMAKPGKAAILSPTYAEHRRAAALCGHDVSQVTTFDALFDADIAVVVNPNNPDGSLTPRADLLRLAAHLAAKGGMLVVDEAFMESAPGDESIAAATAQPGLVVLRSFGKFFGLAGVRLGFAIAETRLAARLNDLLGPWAVSGPTLEYGMQALADRAWQANMQIWLAQQAKELDAVLATYGLRAEGAASLFRLVRHERTQSLFDMLGRHGVLIRNFIDYPDMLRFGLPADANGWTRLEQSLNAWRKE